MKLVKSLLLGSAAGLLAAATSQAADLPYRKAAPIEFVRICDAHGIGFFYIPGTDTCLKVGGNVTFEYAFKSLTRVYNGRNNPVAVRSRDLGGSYARARLQLDARNATAWGTLRTFISADLNHKTGLYGTNGDLIDVDKAYIQWAGISAGRYQSVFDFYADDWNYEGLRNSDQDTTGLAYTATFGGGFSATISIEDQRDRVLGSAAQIGSLQGGGGGNSNLTVTGNANQTGGYRAPDIVGQLDFSQSWGDLRFAAAAHEQNAVAVGAPAGLTGVTSSDYGFALLGGIEINLPMFAPGDQLWIQGQYAEGALGYMLNGNQNSRYFNSSGLGSGTAYQDFDQVFVLNNAGTGFRSEKPTSWSVLAAFQHYWTPSFITRVFGSYIDVEYPNAVLNQVNSFTPFTSNWNEFRVGGQLVWEPVKGFDIGLEGMYARLEQDKPVTEAAVRPNNVTGLLQPTINRHIDGYEGRIHLERDF